MLFGDALPFFVIPVLEFVIDDRHLKHISTVTIIISNNIIHWFLTVWTLHFIQRLIQWGIMGEIATLLPVKTGVTINLPHKKDSNMHVISAYFNTELTSTNISLI